MKLVLKKYGGFTLIEVLLVTIIIGIIFPLMISIYTFIIKANKEFIARQGAIQQGYELFEKINILMQDYTIDYEEYYNRQMVGCSRNVDGFGTGDNFKRNIGTGGYCTEFTAYGNQNSTNRSQISFLTDYHDIYNCSSKENTTKRYSNEAVIVDKDNCGRFGTKQSFGQYKNLFIDVGYHNDSYDDKDIGTTVKTGINAIVDENNIQELYLISHDGKRRLFFRRKLFTGDNIQSQYKIQILRLRGFDAGQDHNFDSNNTEGLYDGQIDTWACDTSMGFKGQGNSVGGAYSDYYLPKDVDDCWVDLTYGSTNIYSWKLSISPKGDSDLFWADGDRQINSYMKIFVVNGVYLPLVRKGTVGSSILDFKVPLETTINMKDFYRE